MKCEFGYCLNCEKEIAPACHACGVSRKPTNDYTEVKLKWSNGASMSTAVCVDCAKGPVWEADKTKLTQAIWDSWDKLKAPYNKDIVLV